MNRIVLPRVQSTNTWLSQHAEGLPSLTVVTTPCQGAGRGQRGNSWESEEGKNLNFSMLWLPGGFPAQCQFAVSEAVALAVADTLEECGIHARVKWPNDIYAGDSKISGILIEHSVTGRDITQTVIGVGLNVNQLRFISDAPNPVSMAMLTGREHSVDDVCKTLAAHIERRLQSTADPASRQALHAQYMGRLWRGDGRMHLFATPDGSRFSAAIAGVASDGMLTLMDQSGAMRTYAFKEVSFIL